MKRPSVSFLLGMIAMLAMLLVGDALTDNEDRDFNALYSAFSKSYEVQQDMLDNRAAIMSVIQSEGLSLSEKKVRLDELWTVNNTLMLSHMIMLIETNDTLSPLYQINSSQGKETISLWAERSKQKSKKVDIIK
tara:strand:- start:313 stop:714 length:402 start_codon:yes stop_codon:yes gene_type:complete